MNHNAVLMCFNIPYDIKEELLYDLFCNAGPIESLHFGKSGKSVFVIYEYEEAVATAKEIFKDVKLKGQTIRMFDKEEIESIYSRQEEQVDRKRRYEVDNGRHGPPLKHRRYDDYSRRSNNHVRFNSPGPESSGGSCHQTFPGLHSEEPPSYHGRYPTERSYQNTMPTGIPNHLGHRSDLLPTDSQNGPRRAYNTGMNENDFRNPYDKPVSRYDYKAKSYRYDDSRNSKYDKPYDRRDNRNSRRSRSPPSRNHYRNRGQQNYSFKSRRY